MKKKVDQPGFSGQVKLHDACPLVVDFFFWRHDSDGRDFVPRLKLVLQFLGLRGHVFSHRNRQPSEDSGSGSSSTYGCS